jgi:hypothetical protein
MDDNGTSVFRKFITIDGAKTEITEPLQPAQRLLTWLQRWSKNTVSERDIRIFGPRCLRSREGANAAAEVLVRNGWLRPEIRRHVGRAWKITRRPILDPTVAP